MSDFKTGDRVRVSATGEIGRVVSVVAEKHGWPTSCRLRGEDGKFILPYRGTRFEAYQLEHVADEDGGQDR